VSFGNAAVFPFPAVQYIPMEVTNICEGILNTLRILPSELIVGDDLKKRRLLLRQEYPISIPEEFSVQSLPILALNLKVNTVRYRGYFITMTGQKKCDYYQLFTLPQHYFYKNKLCFELYDELTGKRLARYSLFIQ
jgi:hypothetical protein